jgi:hypothetical protein
MKLKMELLTINWSNIVVETKALDQLEFVWWIELDKFAAIRQHIGLTLQNNLYQNIGSAMDRHQY